MSAVRQERNIEYPNCKRTSQTFLFKYNMNVSIENPSKVVKTNKFSKDAGYKKSTYKYL